MDSTLIEYLKSGEAWVFVGSGPSNEMGYPSWGILANEAYNLVKSEPAMAVTEMKRKIIESKLKLKDYPGVFDEIKPIIGAPRLLQKLREKVVPKGSGDIYKFIARWPVNVYLTTNYDDEIQKKLTELGSSYLLYSNSEDSMSLLEPSLRAAIFKLHGDLRSETGLILTSSNYKSIGNDPDWEYWRVKMTSVFQMNKLVIVGHSLTDPNIRHVLSVAKKGAGVTKPICWIAPDVPSAEIKNYLEHYRIRVITYDNRDGTHKNLYRLLENVTDYVPPRETVHIKQKIAQAINPSTDSGSGATGFYVFNKLLEQKDFDDKRVDIIVAAIQAIISSLQKLKEFEISEALEIAGWPKELELSEVMKKEVISKTINQNIFIPVGNKFRVNDLAEPQFKESKLKFEHTREAFINSLALRIKNKYRQLNATDVGIISKDIEQSLIGYFREGGLTLATTLFASPNLIKKKGIPSSIVRFINEASARYSDLLRRQAFFTITTDIFVNPAIIEKDYLGRISQGYFCFNMLGVFGDLAREKVDQAKETIWIIDSDAQIPALALGAPTNSVFSDCFKRLSSKGIRLFSTESLFQETFDHFYFANMIVNNYGVDSFDVLSAAKGDLPYTKSNQFLEGFIRWRSSGNPSNWQAYLSAAFGEKYPTQEDIKNKLVSLGVEVIEFSNWPGFEGSDNGLRDKYIRTISQIREQQASVINNVDALKLDDMYKKALPEAEVTVIVKYEREGKYYIISDANISSFAWFISHTSFLNQQVEDGLKFTWQPEAFLNFASTLYSLTDSERIEKSFETILWNIAQSGFNLLDDKTVEMVFSDIIDQAELSLTEQKKIYNETIAQKYGDSPQHVLNNLSPTKRPLAVIQMLYEMVQMKADQLNRAEEIIHSERKKSEIAEKKLKDVEYFRKKMELKQSDAKRKGKKNKLSIKKKKKK